MANGNGEMRQHQVMARGGSPKSGSDFACQSLAEANGNHVTNPHPAEESMKYGGQGSMLGDGERAGPPHISRGAGQMGATAHSDHGPHHLHPQEGNGGVRSLRSVQQG